MDNHPLRLIARFYPAGTLLRPALFFLVLFFAALPVHSKEIIDPRTGRLFLIETDLIVPAGAVDLEVQRTLLTGLAGRGLLGSVWRLNWEVSLSRSGPAIVIEDAAGRVSYAQDKTKPDTFIGPLGDRIVLGKDGRMARSLSDGNRETFDTKGRLVERDYRNGNKVLLSYNAQGRLSRIQGPKGGFLQLATDKDGSVIRVESSTGTTVEYAYEKDRLASVQINGISVTKYAYDPKGALVRIEDPETGVVELAYDATGRVLNRRWADGSLERYQYDDAANQVRHIDARGGVTTIQSSSDKRTLTITDPLGNRSVVEYEATGRPVTITGPTGATVRTTYDTLGRIAAVANPLGQLTRFQYLDGSFQVKSVTRPDGIRMESEYDSQGNLTEVKLGGKSIAALTYLPDGSLSTAKGLGNTGEKFTYDPNGRVRAIADALGTAATFEYDSRGNLVRTIDRLGGASRYQYDSQDRIVSQIDPAGMTARYEYGAEGRLAALIEPTGRVNRFRYDGDRKSAGALPSPAPTTENIYDSRGRLVRKVLANGDTETYRYDAMGNLTELSHSSGARWGFNYDAAGRLLQMSGPHAYKVQYRYDAAGRVVESEDALGRKTGYTYDALGRLTAARNAAGEVWLREYDSAGRLEVIVDSLGRRVRLTYDEYDQLLGVEAAGNQVLKLSYRDGRLAGMTGPAGSASQYSYDPAGLPTLHSYANGESFRVKFNSTGQVVEAADGLGHAWQAAYTPQGQLAAVTEPGGARYSYSYTPLGQLDKLSDARGQGRKFSYDTLGRQTSETDGLGRTTELTFGTGTAIRAVKQPNGEITRMEYDLLGRPTQVTYPGGLSARFRYDAVGNLIEEAMGDYRASYRYDVLDRVVEAAYQPANQTVRYEYDSAGRRKAMEIVGAGRWTYEYDARDNLVQLRDHQGRTTRFEYDDAGRVTLQTLPNGITSRRSYDGRGRMRTLSAQSPSKEVLLNRQYEYDVAGNLVREIREGGVKLDYGYDPSGRLVAVQGPDSQDRLAYDLVGNRLLPDDRAEYDIADQVKRFGSESFTHDEAGRMVSREDGAQKVQYVYDAAGRLSAVRRDGVVAAEYGYDTNGRRVWKKTGGGIRYYIYDGIETLMELDAGRQVIQLWTPGPEIDQPVVLVQRGKAYFPIGDLLGSTVAVTDEGGAVTGRWDYRPFGEWRKPVAGQDEKGVPPRGFTGKEFDPESGLYYFMARYYDARLGRFLTPDPVSGQLSNPASLHPYQYAFNNPLRYRDVTGMAAMDVANSIDRSAAGVGEAVGSSTLGSTAGRVGLTIVSGFARGINWFRGEEGRKSNERLNTFIDKQAAPVVKGVITTAASIVSEPLRLGQATGEMRSRMDQGYNPSAWEQTKMGLTEGFRAIGVIGPAQGVLKAGGAVARKAVGGLANYGRAAGGIREGAELIVPAQQRVGEQIIERMGVGGVELGGRTFVNKAYAPQWYGQKFAHEGGHALVTNTINAIESRLPTFITKRIGENPLSHIRNTSKVWEAIEETVMWTVEKTHSNLFGGPAGKQPFGRSMRAPLVEKTITETGEVITKVLPPTPNSMGEIFTNIAKNYMGQSEGVAKAIGVTLSGGGQLAGWTAALAPFYPAVTALQGGKDTKEPGPLATPGVGTLTGPAGAMSSGLPPGLVDLSDIPFDPRTAPRLPHPLTPDQIARAGQLGDQSQGGIPGTSQPPGQSSGQTGQSQGGYQSGPEVPGTGAPQQPGQQPGLFPPYDPRYDPRGGGMNVPTPGGRDPRGGTASGGNTPSTSGGPPTKLAQNPPGSGGQCRQPLCHMKGQKDCEQGPLPDQNGWFAACYANMLSRCNTGEAGGTGAWCVRKGSDPSCDARARRVCGGSLAAPGSNPTSPIVPACGPATQGKCKCPGGKTGHIPCDKSKGACHCGAG